MLRLHAPRVVTAATIVAAASVVAGCGGTAKVASAPAVPARGGCMSVPRDVGAPGAFAVVRASAPLARRDATGANRRIDPTVWYPRPRSDAAGRQCRYRLILFSHGAGGSPGNYSRLCAHLASQGFVVLAPQHPSQSRGDEAAGRVDDLSYLLDHVHRVMARLAPGFTNPIDTRAIGVAGHSFGGHTVADLAARDRRVGAAMVMAAGANATTTAEIRAATLVLGGADDRLVPLRFVRAFALSLPPATPHGLLVIARAGHSAFPDTCTAAGTCTIVQRAASALFLTYLLHRPEATAALDPARLKDPRVTLTTVRMPPAGPLVSAPRGGG